MYAWLLSFCKRKASTGPSYAALVALLGLALQGKLDLIKGTSRPSSAPAGAGFLQTGSLLAFGDLFLLLPFDMQGVVPNNEASSRSHFLASLAVATAIKCVRGMVSPLYSHRCDYTFLTGHHTPLHGS